MQTEVQESVDTRLKKLSDKFRKARDFNPQEYLKSKKEQINEFLIKNELDSLVLGVSGGIDSAVVLFILEKAASMINSPIKKILPISMPIHGSSGVTGQEEAVNHAKLAVEAAQLEYLEVNLEPASSSIYWNSMEVDEEKMPWAVGQMNSVLRTPVLYYHAAILQTQGLKSLVVGTTNRDEGAYIGFFGKASDAMVDLQIISDLHKSEVYKLAEYMNVPKEIINRTPKGDVWDGRCDEEMIGAPYWFLELYINMKENDMMWIVSELPQEEQAIFNKYSKAIESIHKINKHKYQVGNPAHFLDVMPRKIQDGWN